MREGLTLVEVLVVLGVAALLAVLLVPWLGRAMEGAKVARVLVDLGSIEVALENYHADQGAYPPVTTSCQGSDADEVLQLPRELADGGYLPAGGGKASCMLEDPFHRGGTYKYVAPEAYWLNGQKMMDRYPVWVPEDFPVCESGRGRYWETADAPMSWGIWSVGPGGGGRGFGKAPADAGLWYRGRGAGRWGLVGRMKVRGGESFSTFP